MQRRKFSDEDLFSGDLEDDDTPQRFAKHPAANFPKADLTNPQQFRQTVRHIANVYGTTDPGTREAGRLWYPKVHEAVAKGIRGTGLSQEAGAGMVAALSPNMDWERTNIPAFKEMSSIKPREWDVIRRSAAQPWGSPRTSESADVLRGKSLSQQTDRNLVKGLRIMEGEDPQDVLPRRTAPKTNSFMSNITDPEESPHVTIDARAHDIGQNEMWPWEYSGRGISSAALPSSKKPTLPSGKSNARYGKKTRYEQFEDAYRTAAAGVGEEHPTAMQAVTWLGGKNIELAAPTRSGAPRVKGAVRQKQPYVP